MAKQFKSFKASTIKSSVKLLDLIENYLVNTNKTRIDVGYMFEHCPFCQHKNHFQINTRLNLYMSHSGCCRGGSVIDFYMAMNNVNFNEACQQLGQQFNLTKSVEKVQTNRDKKIIARHEELEAQRLEQLINDFFDWIKVHNNEKLFYRALDLMSKDENRLIHYILNLRSVGYYD